MLASCPAFFQVSRRIQLLRCFSLTDDDESCSDDRIVLEAPLCQIHPLGEVEAERRTTLTCDADSLPVFLTVTRTLADEVMILLSLAIFPCCADGDYTKRAALLLFRDKLQRKHHRASWSVFVVSIGAEGTELGWTPLCHGVRDYSN